MGYRSATLGFASRKAHDRWRWLKKMRSNPWNGRCWVEPRCPRTRSGQRWAKQPRWSHHHLHPHAPKPVPNRNHPTPKTKPGETRGLLLYQAMRLCPGQKQSSESQDKARRNARQVGVSGHVAMPAAPDPTLPSAPHVQLEYTQATCNVRDIV